MADKLSYLKAGMAVKACRIIISFCGEKIYARGLRCEMHHKFADTAALKLFFDGDAYDFNSIMEVNKTKRQNYPTLKNSQNFVR